MAVITFDHVDKEYRLRRENFSALSTSMNRWIDRAWKTLLGNPVRDERFFALRDVSFAVQPGESVGILGPNGAGKTTVLKLIANVTKPTRGKVLAAARIAPLIEVGAGFHPELTGRENVFLNGVILGMSKQEITQKIDEIVAFSELEQFIDSPIKQYSSGMYVRLGFSVAIHSNFDILLADEILAVGDQHFQSKCHAKFEEIKKSGRTLILISHSAEQLKKHCKRGLLIQNGKLVMDNSIETTCAAYANFQKMKEAK